MNNIGGSFAELSLSFTVQRTWRKAKVFHPPKNLLLEQRARIFTYLSRKERGKFFKRQFPFCLAFFSRQDSDNPLEELVQCPICLDKLTEPRMLPCQHTFCLECLKSHVIAKQLILNPSSNSDKILQCPVCQQKVRLENGLESLKALPSNRYIDSLLAVIEKNSPSSPIKLHPDSRCIKCQILLDKHHQVCQHCLQVRR